MENKELEVIENLEEELQAGAAEDPVIKVKCKPTYNFQSIEFEWEITCPMDQVMMFQVYKELLEGLMLLAPTQPTNSTPAVQEEPATEKQIELLKKFKIAYKPGVSKKVASELIQKSMKNNG